jgi:hypothetical protein
METAGRRDGGAVAALGQAARGRRAGTGGSRGGRAAGLRCSGRRGGGCGAGKRVARRCGVLW